MYLSCRKDNVNILDISQTIVDGYFNMMMIVDMEECSKKLLLKLLMIWRKLAKRSALYIKMQRRRNF